MLETLGNLRDVKDIRIKFPTTVYILGSGPNAVKPDSNGIRPIDMIPADGFVIAVNRAAAIPYEINVKWKVSIWMIADWQATQRSYFKRIYDAFDGCMVFSVPAVHRVPNFGARFPHRCFKFNLVSRDELKNKVYKPAAGGLFRPDASVSGCALELCFKHSKYNNGPIEQVNFLGVDMTADADFRGNLAKDWRHGIEWKNRLILDSEIGYMKSKDLKIFTMSDTRLQNVEKIIDDRFHKIRGFTLQMKNQDINQLDQSIEQLEDFLTKAKETRQTITQLIDKAEPIPSDKPELPSVAYLTMAWIPEFTLDNIISAIDQDYPAELKTLYLLNQAPYPIHYDADAIMKEFGLKIVEIDVPGTWPAVWMGKLKKFLDVVKEQVVVVFDEGKRYRHTYTRISIDTLYQNNAKACWNHDQILCKRTENKPVIEKHHYKPPYGTMAIKIHFLRQAAAELNRQFPKQLLVTKGDRLVPLDGPLCQIIEKMFPGEIIDGEQQRFYKFHSKSNSYMNKHRTDPSENIDVKR